MVHHHLSGHKSRTLACTGPVPSSPVACTDHICMRKFPMKWLNASCFLYLLCITANRSGKVCVRPSMHNIFWLVDIFLTIQKRTKFCTINVALQEKFVIGTRSPPGEVKILRLEHESSSIPWKSAIQVSL